MSADMYHFPNMLAWPERVLAGAVAFASVVAGRSEPEQSVREPVAVTMVSDSVLHHRGPLSARSVLADCISSAAAAAAGCVAPSRI